MPEWKSFSMGDGASPLTESPIQHLSQTATPAPGMEADEAAEKWGTEVSEVSIERIENGGFVPRSDEVLEMDYPTAQTNSLLSLMLRVLASRFTANQQIRRGFRSKHAWSSTLREQLSSTCLA